MAPNNKPSSINSIKDHKLTKRRLLKALSSAGFGAASVNAITVDDVKAADSDQVTIAITCDGERKKRVSSDWYDHLVRARRVKNEIEENWLYSTDSGKDSYDDVFAVWLDAGTDSNNPHVKVTIDKNSSSKEETRGNVPERRDNVRIDVEEAPREHEQVCEPKCKQDTSEMPGGLSVSINGNGGSLGPQAWDNKDGTWTLTTAGHVAAQEGTCGDDLIGSNVEHCGEYIGYVKDIDHSLDMCIIEPAYDVEPIPEVWNPDDHSSRWGTITDTLSADGVDYWMGDNPNNNQRKVWKYGVGSCYSEGYVHARGTKEDPEVNNPCTPDPKTWNECVRWGTINSIWGGDSGSIAFGADPDSDDFFAVCQNSWRWYNYSAGPAGYAWRNKHGYSWRTF